MIKNNEEYSKGLLSPSLPAEPGPKARLASFLANYYTTTHPEGSRDTAAFCRPLSHADCLFLTRLPPLLRRRPCDRKHCPTATKIIEFLLASLRTSRSKRIRKARSDRHENPPFSHFPSVSKLRIARSALVSDALPIAVAMHPLAGLAPGNWLCFPSARSASLTITSVPSSTYTQIGFVCSNAPATHLLYSLLSGRRPPPMPSAGNWSSRRTMALLVR